MTDDIATTARLMKIADAVEEFERQGVAEALSNLNFDPGISASGIKAADGDVIQFPGSPRGH